MCKCLKRFIGIIVIPGLSIIAFIFSAISTFEYAESFHAKPHYEYEYRPSNTSSSNRYVLSSGCFPDWTKDSVDFVNYMEVNYVYSLFIISIIINGLSLLTNNVKRVYKKYYESETIMFRLKVASGICTYLALVFCVPAQYATRIKYEKCLEIAGIMKTLMSVGYYSWINAGMWSALLLPLFYLSKFFWKNDWFHNGWASCLCIAIMWLLGLGYLIFALVAKYTSFIAPQFGWDLCLNFDIISAFFNFRPWQLLRGNRVSLLS